MSILTIKPNKQKHKHIMRWATIMYRREVYQDCPHEIDPDGTTRWRRLLHRVPEKQVDPMFGYGGRPWDNK